MESAAFGRLAVSLPQMGKVAPQATDGMIDVSPALSVNVGLRIQSSIISGPTFPGMERYRRSRGKGCLIVQGTYGVSSQKIPVPNEENVSQ